MVEVLICINVTFSNILDISYWRNLLTKEPLVRDENHIPTSWYCGMSKEQYVNYVHDDYKFTNNKL
jgi:hypothetical protein